MRIVKPDEDMDKEHLPPAHSEPAPLTARYPVKAGYTVASLLTLLFAGLPFRGIYYLPWWLRQNPKWTFKQAMMVSLIKFYHIFSPAIRLQLTAPARAGGAGGKEECFELIKPARSELLQGVLSKEKTTIRPVERPGNWYPTKYDIDRDGDKKVLLYFFGGAYVMGDHKAHTYQGLLDKLLPAIGNAKFFSVGYRLAAAKGNHFPAALMDAMSAYCHLLEKGIKPEQIVFMGDSAGANLALAMIRYLSETSGVGLPLPAAAILGCPWVDLTPKATRISQHHNYRYEMITQELLEWGVRGLVPSNMTADDPYISPGLHPFEIKLPVWVDYNENETLCDSIKEFVTGFKALPTNDIEVFASQEGTHDTLMWGVPMGFDAIVDDSVASIKEFLDRRNI